MRSLVSGALALVLQVGCGQDVVAIHDGDAVVLEVEVSRAVTAAERMRGLRGRSLGAGEGLLLVFPIEDELCLANGDVDQPIDAVFVGADAAVTAVERDVPAGDPTVRCATGRWILEVPAGEASAVDPGMLTTGL